jgi:hypothetical protein
MLPLKKPVEMQPPLDVYPAKAPPVSTACMARLPATVQAARRDNIGLSLAGGFRRPLHG